jgi:hypothetical protein
MPWAARFDADRYGPEDHMGKGMLRSTAQNVYQSGFCFGEKRSPILTHPVSAQYRIDGCRADHRLYILGSTINARSKLSRTGTR